MNKRLNRELQIANLLELKEKLIKSMQKVQQKTYELAQQEAEAKAKTEAENNAKID